MLDKHQLRAWARTQPPPTSAESSGVVAGIERFLAGGDISSVLTYMPMRSELDLTALPTALPHLRWCVTRTPEEGWLTVHPYDSPRQMHRFGFEQPVDGAAEVDPATIDVLLTPGLVFDRTGGRVGHGAGYYDELLARMPQVDSVGVTLERLVVDRVPLLAHDRRVQWLATEEGVKRCS